MITPVQIRAARAMPDISQATLAKAAGLSPTALIAIETGHSDPRSSTLRNIQAALERKGIIFGEGGGVTLGPEPEIFTVPEGIAHDRKAVALGLQVANAQRRLAGKPLLVLPEDET